MGRRERFVDGGGVEVADTRVNAGLIAAAQEAEALRSLPAKLSLAEATMQKMVEVEQERAQEIAALRAECAALRSAAEGLDHFAWSAVMADCEEARQGLQGRIDRLRATLAAQPGEALAVVREMQGAIAATLASNLSTARAGVISSLASAEESARRLFGEPQA